MSEPMKLMFDLAYDSIVSFSCISRNIRKGAPVYIELKNPTRFESIGYVRLVQNVNEEHDTKFVVCEIDREQWLGVESGIFTEVVQFPDGRLIMQAPPVRSSDEFCLFHNIGYTAFVPNEFIDNKQKISTKELERELRLED